MLNTIILNKAAKTRPVIQSAISYPFVQEPLPFAVDALEPHIDAQTMRIHHGMHHQGYIAKLNEALKDYPQLHDFSIEALLHRLNEVPPSIQEAVRNHGGGHAHHQMFWKMLKPADGNIKPSDLFLEVIERSFGSFNAFKSRFVETGMKHFGSGWVFLVMNIADGKLEIFSRPNQNSVFQEKKAVLLINDLWEHAYYLQYKNSRLDYLNAFWNVVNWDYVDQRFEEQIHAIA